MKKIKYIILGLLFTFSMNSCEDTLTEDPASELTPEAFLSTTDGVVALFTSAYSIYVYSGYTELLDNMYLYGMTDHTGDSQFQSGGGFNGLVLPYINFTWDPTTAGLSIYWNQSYAAIRDINIILEGLSDVEGFTQAETDEFILASRLMRADIYMRLFDWFGPVPLRTATDDAFDLPRNTQEEVLAFISSEMEEIIPLLPLPGEALNVWTDRGTAAGLYARHLLSQKDWAGAAEYTKLVMDLGYYELFPDYPSLFDVANEFQNNPSQREIMLARPMINTVDEGSIIISNSFPPGYATSDKLPEIVFTSSMRNFGSQYRIRDDFADSFDQVNDTRYNRIIDNYINASGELVDLTAADVDNRRSLKYYDPDGTFDMGNDFPILRYADILLMRAEALNELNGPNQESIDLLNMVRERAGLEGFAVSDFTSTESLRDHIILNERRWEFQEEHMRRRDLIRHSSFISRAQARGAVTAADFHVLFPIPQEEINGNPNMVQNAGY